MAASREPVSFIVPAFNCASTIRDAVRSVFNGNFESGDEVVLIDDCSTDNTAQVLKELTEHERSVHIVTHRENRGTAAASRNTGIEVASHELLFCLDSDNVLVPGSVHDLCRYMRAARADAAAFGEIHYFTKTTRQVSHRWIYRETITLADALTGYFWPGPSGNYLFTRESWARAGRYYEPSLENRSLDSWVFGIHQLGTGSKLVTLPNTWYFHRYGHESHYVRNSAKGNQSLAALVGLIPFLDRLEDDDVEYLFSREGRYQWYERLAERPLNVKGQEPGKNGSVQYAALHGLEKTRQLVTSKSKKIFQKLRRRPG